MLKSSIESRDSVGDNTMTNEFLTSTSSDSSAYMDPYETTVNTSVDSIISTDISSSELQALDGGEVVDNKRVRRPPNRFGYTNMCTSNNLPGAEEIDFSEALCGPEAEQCVRSCRHLSAMRRGNSSMYQVTLQ